MTGRRKINRDFHVVLPIETIEGIAALSERGILAEGIAVLWDHWCKCQVKVSEMSGTAPEIEYTESSDEKE